jgi:hypothetical protein
MLIEMLTKLIAKLLLNLPMFLDYLDDAIYSIILYGLGLKRFWHIEKLEYF